MIVRFYRDRDWQWKLVSSVTFATMLLPSDRGLAESIVIPDDTLGNEASQVRAIDDLTQLIEGGALRDSNLFHSFLEFNVAEGDRVYFANPLDVTSILTRVTGSNPSNILGQLGVLGNADLFVLNPNGIVFGENASLDIEGSFYAIAAPEIPLGDGVFSAAEPESSHLLSISPDVSLFNYLGNGTGDITHHGNLSVGDGQSLTLLGDTVLSSGELTATGGTVRLLGNHVGLIEQATIDVSAPTGGGTVLIGGEFQGQTGMPTAERTYVGPEVMILADAYGSGNGGRVIVWADGATQFAGSIWARGGEAGGNGGFVEVSGAESLSFTGTVDTRAVQGEDGTLLLDPAIITISNVAPSDFVTVDDSSDVFDDFLYGEAEDSGQNSHLTPATVVSLLNLSDLTLEATDLISVESDVIASSENDLTLRADEINVLGARLNQSGGGDLILETPQAPGNSIDVQTGTLSTDVPSDGTVNGGDIVITTFDLNVTNAGGISANTSGQDNAGQVIIEASGDVTVENGASILSLVNGDAEGDSGGISIEAANLNVLNTAVISTSTSGSGNSGQLQITASDTVIIDGEDTFILSAANADAVGESGGIAITTGNLSVLNGAAIDTSTFGIGNSGESSISASGDVIIDGEDSLISSSVASGAGGSSGGIATNSNNLSVTNNGAISASTFGTGNSGQISVNTSGNIVVDGEDSLISSSVAAGAGGSSDGIAINTNNLAVINNGALTTNTFGTGDSGQISINASGDVNVSGEESLISSSVAAEANGNSGRVTVNTNNLSVSNSGAISTSNFGTGSSGEITIDASGDVIFDGEGTLISSNVNPEVSGNSNDVSINANTLDVINGAIVSADTFGSGNSGAVRVNIDEDLTVDNLDTSITSEKRLDAEGTSGGVFINAGNLIVLEDIDDMESSTNEDTFEDTFEITAEENSYNTLIFDLNADASTQGWQELVSLLCISRNPQSGNSFIIPGTGGLPTTPENSITSTYTTGTVEPLTNPNFTELDNRGWQLGDPITEPEIATQLADGRIIFARYCSAEAVSLNFDVAEFTLSDDPQQGQIQDSAIAAQFRSP